MNFELIAIGPAHVELAAAIHRQCFVQPWDVKAMAEMLGMPGAFGWIAGSGHPVGLVLARVAADEAEVVTIGVLPGERGKGHAGRLLDAALVSAKQAGAVSMFLEVAEANESARGLYASRGFAPVGRRPDYYGAGGHALVLRRELLPCP